MAHISLNRTTCVSVIRTCILHVFYIIIMLRMRYKNCSWFDESMFQEKVRIENENEKWLCHPNMNKMLITYNTKIKHDNIAL